MARWYSFLAWHLVTGRPHVTDATNAGRTMLFNLKTQDWDDELLAMLDIPRACLPQVVDTAQVIGTLDPAILGRPIPVAAMAGDQHASLFGQACLNPRHGEEHLRHGLLYAHEHRRGAGCQPQRAAVHPWPGALGASPPMPWRAAYSWAAPPSSGCGTK